jgi:hypothetical protein
MREKELLREISHLAQQVAVDAAWKKFIVELQSKMEKFLKFRIEEVPKSYKNAPPESAEYKMYCDQVRFKKEVRLALCKVCEQIVRKECHRKLLETHTDIDKRTKVKKCGIASEAAVQDDVPCKSAMTGSILLSLSPTARRRLQLTLSSVLPGWEIEDDEDPGVAAGHEDEPFSVGTHVTWSKSDGDIPEGIVGTVVHVDHARRRVAFPDLEFPGVAADREFNLKAEELVSHEDVLADAAAEERKRRALFASLDADDSGHLEADEVKTLLKRLAVKRLSKRKLKQGFLRMDTDGNGEISWEEFNAWFLDLGDGHQDNLQ